METVENITSPHFEMRNIIKNNQLICLFYIKKEFRSVFEAELMDYLKEVNERVKKYTNMPILVGYSRPYSVLSDTHTRYHRIITNLDQGYFFPSQTTNMLDEEREYISFSKEIDDYIQKNLSIAVFNHDSNLIVKTLNEACRQFMEQKVMSTVAKTILLHTLIRFSQETDFYLLVNYEFIERRLYTVMTEIVSFPLLQKLFSLIGELSEQARKIYERDDSNRLTIAMQYIQKYYCHKISLASISNYLALTPNYFCGWFKKQTGENFGDMVIRYRIEAAKTMLTCSKKKMYEIAGEVGYEEIVSFNRVFKKSVGMTPDQYRKACTVE
jgi:YesN/AraC family two-component response regulator